MLLECLIKSVYVYETIITLVLKNFKENNHGRFVKVIRANTVEKNKVLVIFYEKVYTLFRRKR